MKKIQKPRMEYRYYDILGGSPLLVLLGENGNRIMEKEQIFSISIIIWK